METIRKTSEEEMILEFLKGELNSNRFNDKLKEVLSKLNLNTDIILNGDVSSEKENILRLKIMKLFRGYPDEELFENFPKIDKWEYKMLKEDDINNIFYINYDYWNELSNETSKPLEASKNIKNGKEIYNVSNKPFLEGVKYLENNSFPPVILITCNDKKYLIIEGHSRMTVYGLNPEKFEGTYAYVGYCSVDEMKKYDSRELLYKKDDVMDNYITVFESENIKYIKLNEALLQNYLEMYNDKNIQKSLFKKEKNFSSKQILNWIKKVLENNSYEFSMIDKKTREYIGDISVINIEGDSGELAISVTPTKQGNHYATEAINAILEYCYNELCLKNIIVNVCNDNFKAINLYKKVGFVEKDRNEYTLKMEHKNII